MYSHTVFWWVVDGHVRRLSGRLQALLLTEVLQDATLQKSYSSISLRDASYFTRGLVAFHGSRSISSSTTVMKNSQKEQQSLYMPNPCSLTWTAPSNRKENRVGRCFLASQATQRGSEFCILLYTPTSATSFVCD
jgi:hypothetical protein